MQCGLIHQRVKNHDSFFQNSDLCMESEDSKSNKLQEEVSTTNFLRDVPLVALVPVYVPLLGQNLVLGSHQNPLLGLNQNTIPGFSQNSLLGSNQNPLLGSSQNPVLGLSQNPVVSLSQNPVSGFSQNPVQGLSQNPVPGLSQNPVPGLCQNPVPWLSQNPVVSLSQNPVPGLSQNPVLESNLDQNSTLVSSEEKQQIDVLNEIKIEEHNDLNDQINLDRVSSFFNILKTNFF